MFAIDFLQYKQLGLTTSKRQAGHGLHGFLEIVAALL